MTKCRVTLGGIPLGGVGAVVWRFVTGTEPYATTFHVHKDVWNQRLKQHLGKPLELVVTDSRRQTYRIKDIYVLHTAPSDSPNRVYFRVADKRWLWIYTLVSRDYNVPRKSGDRVSINNNIHKRPVEVDVTVDEYNYKPWSLKDGENRWTPKDAVKDVLDILVGADGYTVESFPIADGGEFSLQNVSLRDSGDVALARLLSYIPAASVYVDGDGMVRVIDAADFDGMQEYRNSLPPDTWNGDSLAYVDRKAIRPKDVAVHYQREVEIVFEYSDDYSGSTISPPVKDAPFLENVIPVVDATKRDGSTPIEFTMYNPKTGKSTTQECAPGTWIEARQWLAVMDDDKPDGSWDWNFDTISLHWIKGNLEKALGGDTVYVKDLSESRNVAARVQALRKHWRQTFRISPRYMNRIRDLQALRVAIIHPVTGARGPALVWGQACVIPTKKGLLAARKDPERAGVYWQIDNLPSAGEDLNTVSPSPATIQILDRDQGIFRVEWIGSPFGTTAAIIPCNTEDSSGTLQVPTRDLSKQDTDIMGPNMRVEGGGNEFFLKDSMEFKCLMTMVPGAPNNKTQFHVETLAASDIADVFQKEYRIQNGDGPTLDVFIPPGESAARFQWQRDTQARATIILLLGLNEDDPNAAGLPADDPKTPKIDESAMNGFVLINKELELYEHSRGAAAEAISAFADNLEGASSTVMTRNGLKLKGNMSGASVQIDGAPSGRVSTTHEFPGQSAPVSRFAMLNETARQMVLGIVPWDKGD